MKKFDIAIVGGDKRTACMASVFARKGYSVTCFGTTKIPVDDRVHHASTLQEAITGAPIVVGGIPFEKKGNLYFSEALPPIPLPELQRMLRKHHKVFGGVIPEDFKNLCEKRKISCYDFMLEEPLTIFNATATAEGAILEALLHKSTLLHQSNILVLGYGRCGKVLTDKLKGLSTRVTVGSEIAGELALASALGIDTLHLSALPQKVGCYEYVFNTIPATVLTRSCLEKMDHNALVIDIASNRVGVDYEAAALIKRNILFCPGLPGKYASLSCAEQLAEFVIRKTGRGLCNESEQ